MNEQQFTVWLKGFIDLHGAPPTPEQWEKIKEEVAKIFGPKLIPSALPAALRPEDRLIC
jgi:hypothetical protein